MYRVVSIAIVALLATPGGAAEPPPPPGVTNGAVSVPGLEQVPKAAAPDALYAIPTRLDRVGRIVVPIRVNGRGPFHFVLDTGANATVIAPHLAGTLGLDIDPAQTVVMSGVTGSASVPTVAGADIEANGLTFHGQRMAVSDASGVGTDGVLGVDALREKAVLVDFNGDQVRVLDARKHRPADRFVRIPAKLRLGNLIMVDALVASHKVKAVIDTGGQRTLGNTALFELLGYRHQIPARDAAQEVIGATNTPQQGERHVVHTVVLGDLTVTNMTVTFGPFYIFKLWGLQSQPTIVIGMDMIGTLGEFGVDYWRHEVLVRTELRRRRH
jgi:predicted aspartyl protease